MKKTAFRKIEKKLKKMERVNDNVSWRDVRTLKYSREVGRDKLFSFIRSEMRPGYSLLFDFEQLVRGRIEIKPFIGKKGGYLCPTDPPLWIKEGAEKGQKE
ncbi:hypothetical protein MYX84_15460 [Acidobacteria bacterium AH-259-O06]|nr:hypothetical protein [Acidobacteria bacterium AH-259-O06]